MPFCEYWLPVSRRHIFNILFDIDATHFKERLMLPENERKQLFRINSFLISATPQ